MPSMEAGESGASLPSVQRNCTATKGGKQENENVTIQALKKVETNVLVATLKN